MGRAWTNKEGMCGQVEEKALLPWPSLGGNEVSETIYKYNSNSTYQLWVCGASCLTMPRRVKLNVVTHISTKIIPSLHKAHEDRLVWLILFYLAKHSLKVFLNTFKIRPTIFDLKVWVSIWFSSNITSFPIYFQFYHYYKKQNLFCSTTTLDTWIQ